DGTGCGGLLWGPHRSDRGSTRYYRVGRSKKRAPLRVARTSHLLDAGKQRESDRRAARPGRLTAIRCSERETFSFHPKASRHARSQSLTLKLDPSLTFFAISLPKRRPEAIAAVIPSPTIGGHTERASPTRRTPSSGAP